MPQGASRDSGGEPKRRWSGVDAATREAAVKAIYVNRPATQQFTGLFDRVRACRRAMPEPQCILITGDTGTGKSALIRQYQAAHPASRVNGGLVQPVVSFELPGTCTPLGALAFLLKALHDPSGGAGRLHDLIARCIDQLPKQQVEIVFADEWQHMTEHGASRINKAADIVKQVAKATNTPFAMLGMPTAKAIIERSPQLAGITPHRKTIGKFTYDTVVERTEFRSFLTDLDLALPFDNVAGFSDPRTATRLWEATKGHMRSLMTLIRQAAVHGIERGSQGIEAEDLRHGYDETPGIDYSANPF